MNAMLLLLAAIAHGTEPLVIEQRCDWIEINTLVSFDWCVEKREWKTNVVFSQVIFWNGAGRDECVAWRMVDKVRFISEDERGVTLTWHDNEVLRKVRAKFLIETATDRDPELLNRELMGKEQRRELGKPAERLYPSLKIMRLKEVER